MMTRRLSDEKPMTMDLHEIMKAIHFTKEVISTSKWKVGDLWH